MPETVISLKTAFINSQVRLLNRPLELPNDLASKSDIPAKTLDHVMREANLRLRRHNKSVYDALAIRSIADQIDSLYWNAAEPENPIFDARNADEDIIRKGDDLTDPRSIDRLPEELPTSDEYAELYQTLKDLSRQRTDLLQKLETYQALQERLKPLQDPQNSIQPNLVTRDAALNDELANIKRFGLRVASQAAGMKRRRDDDMHASLDMVGQEKIKLRAALNAAV